MLSGCGIQRPAVDRLFGGEAVSSNQYPWLAVVNAGSTSFSGSLVSDRHIVTAASPLYGLPSNNVSVILGVRDRCGLGSAPVIGVESVIIHPGYSPTTSDNDIALVRMNHPISFDNHISPICLPLSGSQRAGSVATVASWGNYSEDSSCVPKVASLPILESQTCLTGAVNNSLVTGDKGCLGPAGTTSVICSEDVGAPVMTQWIRGYQFRLSGLISSTSCQEQTTPLFTRVYEHTAWIRRLIASDCQCF
ncbi:hypothetical protein ABMA27_001419 [Loxostege sticticalis]|uniref:Peptidase S1 domain-containing protein n=1 Tax=Loxostege sticticalis TaxID=481309 RepID=A0ABR3HYE9_LOXSC